MNQLPEYLNSKIIEQYGEELTKEIIDGYKVNRLTTFRVNTIKACKEEIEAILKDNDIEFETVSWYKDAYIVKNAKEDKLTSLPIYEEGKIYIQSLSSMIPPIILSPRENADILDMAAAPGGKTTQLAALSDNKAHITACEMNKIRFDRLKYNVEKQGAKCVYVMAKDSRNLEDFFSFDQILLDAPCTGSGTINLENNIRFEEGYLSKLAKTQTALLDKAMRLLKKGEELVYSTCSILEDENENVVSKIINKYNASIVPIEFDGMENIPLLPTKLPGTLVVKPNELFEGFFVVKIKK